MQQDSIPPKYHIQTEGRWISYIQIGSIQYFQTKWLVAENDVDSVIGNVTHHPNDHNIPDGAIISPIFYQNEEVYSIKNVSLNDCIALKYKLAETSKGAIYRYYVFAATGKQNNATIEAMDKALRDAEEEARKAEAAARQYIRDNPWPNRIIFNGQPYTLVNYNGHSGVFKEMIGNKLGEVKRQIETVGAYPKDYRWKDGDASHIPAQCPIHAIKNIDSRYYIAANRNVYANDNLQSEKLEKEAENMVKAFGTWLDNARGYNSFLFQNGYSNSSAHLIAVAKYPEDENQQPDINVSITKVGLEVKENPVFAFGPIPEGILEISFSPERSLKYFKKQGGELVPHKIYDNMEDRSYNILLSLLIDADILNAEEDDSHFEDFEHLYVYYGNGKKKIIPLFKNTNRPGMVRLINAIMNIPSQVFSNGETTSMIGGF